MTDIYYELCERHTMAILLYILEHENVHDTSFYEITEHHDGAVNMAKELAKMGLVKIKHEDKPFAKTAYSLTEVERRSS